MHNEENMEAVSLEAMLSEEQPDGGVAWLR
jgi:hypothetical protein